LSLSDFIKNSYRHLFYYVGYFLFVIHGWLLVFKLPKTLSEVFKAFRPNGAGITNSKFWAFGIKDAKFRNWYDKIARDMYNQGRFGIAWDDGLGMPLGDRIYNNYITYWLHYNLKTRTMMALGYLLMVSTTIYFSVSYFNISLGILLGLIVAGSPLVVSYYTHLGKPEFFWWGVVQAAVVVGFSGQALTGGILWSFLALVNLPISIMFLLMIGPSLLWHHYSSGSIELLLVGMFPGILKITLRVIHMYRSRYLFSVLSEQSRIWKRRWYPSKSELSWWIPFLLSVSSSAYNSQLYIIGISLIVFSIGSYWANYRMLYMNDPESFNLAFWVISFGFAATTNTTFGLLFAVLMIYNNPAICGIPFNKSSQNDFNNIKNKFRIGMQRLKDFPALTPMSFPISKNMDSFFNLIPDGSRVLFESDGDPRTESQLKHLYSWTDRFLPQRRVDLLNEVHIRVVEPKLVDEYIVKFNALDMTADKIHLLCQSLGVSYLVTFTRDTTELLKGIGYSELTRVDLSKELKLQRVLSLPQKKLVLLVSSDPVSVIDPIVKWELHGNKLTWEARAGQSYTIRYRYNPQFKAYQFNENLNIEPFMPIKDLTLQFMKIKTDYNGPVEISFNSPWI